MISLKKNVLNNAYILGCRVKYFLTYSLMLSLGTVFGVEVTDSLDLDDHNQVIPSLTGSGIVDIGFSPKTVLTLQGGEFEGHIIGFGQVNIDTNERVILQADNSYTGGTAVLKGKLALQKGGALASTSSITLHPSTEFDISQIDAASLTLANVNSNDSTAKISLGTKKLVVGAPLSSAFEGKIEGHLGSQWVKKGDGEIALTGKKDRNVFLIASEGELVGNTDSLKGNMSIDSGATVTFAQNKKGIFEGQIRGSGNIHVKGSQELHFLRGVDLFSGQTVVKEGKLILNTTIGGDVRVTDGAILSGTGTVKGDLVIQKGGVLEAKIDQSGKGSFFNIQGKAHLNDGRVELALSSNKFLLNHRYPLLHADEGVVSTFASIEPSGKESRPLYNSRLFYTETDVLFELQPALVNGATTRNQRQTAHQLDIFSTNNPLLTELIGLSPAEISLVLDSLIGQPQIHDLFAVELVNREFLRRLYDPLRDLISADPCCECSPWCGWRAWIEGGGGNAALYSTSDLDGFTMSFGEITGGVQKSFCQDFTVGIAGSYARGRLKHYQGSSRLNSTLVGLYGLYRPDPFYILTDVTYGYFNHKISRTLFLPAPSFITHSRPELNQITLYAEGGTDFLWCNVLFQPFLGTELGGIWKNRVIESGGGEFNLAINDRNEAKLYSRLGFHATTNSFLCGIRASLDAAWQCRLTSNRNYLEERFTGFGTLFQVDGITVDRNSFQYAATLLYPMSNVWTIFAEGDGEVWGNASIYALTLGLTASW